MSEPEAIQKIGEIVCGPYWRTRLPTKLGVNRLTVARWATGENTPRGRNLKALVRLADKHGASDLVPIEWRPSKAPASEPCQKLPLANGPLDPDARAHLAYWLDIAESVFLLRAQTYYALTKEPYEYPDGNLIAGYRCGTLCGHCGTPFETVVAVEHMRAGTGRRYCLACSPAKNVDSDEKNALDKTNNIDKPAA